MTHRKLQTVCLTAIALSATGSTARSAAPAPTSRPTTTTSKPTAADEELIRKLLRGATGKDKGPAFERVIEGMHASRVKLAIQFDPGNDTQTIQRQILTDLDEAIAEAWRSQQRVPSPTTKQSDSDPKRKRQTTSSESSGQQQQQQDPDSASNQPMPDERATRGRPITTSRPGGTIRELRRGWGQLPSRDRDEVVQGVGQDYLTKYREWIERYYRALANPEGE
ncbi:MAG: hypothetical protein JXQ73_11215 [Phycisphaerae bacterium]|nr:hypothetical protein [Phycisphaerae bacterium]